MATDASHDANLLLSLAYASTDAERATPPMSPITPPASPLRDCGPDESFDMRHQVCLNALKIQILQLRRQSGLAQLAQLCRRDAVAVTTMSPLTPPASPLRFCGPDEDLDMRTLVYPNALPNPDTRAAIVHATVPHSVSTSPTHPRQSGLMAASVPLKTV